MFGSSSRRTTSATSDGNYQLEIQEYGGGKGPVRFSFKEDSCIARVDVPGCSVEESEFAFKETYIGFALREKDQNNQDERKYTGFVKFDTDVYDVMNAKINLLRGVFWITVPKKKPQA